MVEDITVVAMAAVMVVATVGIANIPN